jgi:hypothetical protein
MAERYAHLADHAFLESDLSTIRGYAAPVSTDNGFLLVKKFHVLFAEFAAKPDFDRKMYALPVHGMPAEGMPVRYRGLDRDALSCSAAGSLGEARMEELKREGRVDPEDELIATPDDARDVLRWIDQELPGAYEIIWTRIAGASAQPPDGWLSLGFEPSYFGGDHFSAICDSMCFPRWHGTDEEGTLFKDYFVRLNANGLFDDADTARAFLTYYLSFDWTETGDYKIAEVWAEPAAY